MKKILLPLITLIFFAVCTSSVRAASLEVSRNSNFSSEDLNFNSGDRVYIRVESDGSGNSQKVLNIRDNQYNLVSSVDLAKSGNQFSASFNAPNNQGYFSLEVVIEGDGKSSKSVKTIKVGSPDSANVKVNVNSSVKGTKSANWTNGSNESNETNKEIFEEENKQVNSTVSPTPEVYGSQSDSTDQVKPAKGNWFFKFFTNIFSFFWPFK